jgi:RNA polymerase sigma-70 factor (ECF subfamily)
MVPSPSKKAAFNPNDNELIRQVAEGDENAFRELYSRYHLPVFNYILKLIHQPSNAEEILQDVFVGVWQGAGKFRGKASVKTWIFRITHNRTVSWLRKDKKNQLALEDISQISIKSETPLPEEYLIAKGEHDLIHSALEQLAPIHRSVVVLTFGYGFSYKEIALIMGVPIGTVKSRMSYALRYLQAEIEKQKNEQIR